MPIANRLDESQTPSGCFRRREKSVDLAVRLLSNIDPVRYPGSEAVPQDCLICGRGPQGGFKKDR